ncbi:MAG TPA: ATP-binding protein [Polyangiaceae bacterium]|jgi:PAS domain S-box-containing protein|nr:ATP-binding protein [Polyangiaceae bacterium]
MIRSEMPSGPNARWEWLRAPVFADEAKTHEAFLLNVIVWSMVLVPPPYVLFTLLRTPQFSGRALVQGAFGEVINGVLLILLRRGAVRLASVLQVAALFAFMTATAMTLGGVHSPAYQLGYSLAIVIVGVLIGVRGAAVVTLAAIICGFIMQSRGASDALLVSERASVWIVSVVIFPVIAVVQYLASRTVRNALERASVGEQKFRLLADASFEGIIIHDQGVIVEANQRFAELFGFARAKDLVGSDRDDRFLTPESQAGQVAGSETGAEVEVIGVRRDGSQFPAEMQARAIEYRGKVRQAVAVRDITERKRAAAERVKLEQSLSRAERLESIGRLAGGVAHDFNNLLTAIMGNVSLMQEELRGDPGIAERLAEVMQASEGAARLTRQLLTVGQKQATRPELLDPNKVITDTQRVLLRLLGAQVDLHTKLGEGVGELVMDPVQLEQILVNLCVNARDAMPAGGGLEIRTDRTNLGPEDARAFSEAQPGDFVRITVSDTGTGMPDDVLSHVFEPFFTTKDAGQGTGLGLATVHGIVLQNRGVVRIFSEVGKGTRVEVCLPRASEANAGSASA